MHVLLGPKGEAIFVGGQVWRSRSVVLHNFFIRVHLTIAMLFSLIQIFWECMEQEIRQLLAWFLPFISPISRDYRPTLLIDNTFGFVPNQPPASVMHVTHVPLLIRTFRTIGLVVVLFSI